MWTEAARCTGKRSGRAGRPPLYRNSFLLVRLRLAGKRRFVIPFSLAVLAQTLEGLADLAWLFGGLFPGAGRSRLPDWLRGLGEAHAPAGVYELFRFCAESLEILRTGGRPYRLAEVETEEVRVVVDMV